MSPKVVHIALFVARPLDRNVRTPSNCVWSAIFFQKAYGRGKIAFIIEKRKRDGGRRCRARSSEGSPNQPPASHVLPSLYKVIFLAPALRTQLGYPRNSQLLTEPLSTIVTINRCSYYVTNIEDASFFNITYLRYSCYGNSITT